MNLSDWCAAERGRISRLAKHLKVSVSAASQMVNGKIPVPVRRYRKIVNFTGNQVTLDDLVPKKGR